MRQAREEMARLEDVNDLESSRQAMALKMKKQDLESETAEVPVNNLKDV